LVSAHQRNELDALLDCGLLFVDAGERFCSGMIGRYAIGSDTLADTLLESIETGDQRIISFVKASPIVAEIERHRGRGVPLKLVAKYLELLGSALRKIVELHPASAIYSSTTVIRVQRTQDGRWSVQMRRADGTETEASADRIVTACGGQQSRESALISPIAPDFTLTSAGLASRTMISDTLLAKGAPEFVRAKLADISDPKIVIIGGSHSAMSSAWTLLNLTGQPFGEGAVSILHCRQFRIYYPSRAEALKDGYTDFTDADFCPLTNRLFRLAGLRLDSRELGRRILRIGNAAPEPRVRLVPLDRESPLPAATRSMLEEADLIVTAFGYRPRVPDFFDESGLRIRLQADDPTLALPLVDTDCRVLNSEGSPLPDVYGVGLASGFKYTGALGGEPSFSGQTNGLWLYQNNIGRILCDRMMESSLVGGIANHE
jgi:hypothetical protein